MYTRFLTETLKKAFQQFPVLTLTGPRQSGKTTLLRYLFPEKPYVSMEDPDQRKRFLSDPRGFLNHYKQGAFFDEFQQTPELPSYLQRLVDENPESGQFLLSGSHQFEVMNTVSQSLAGRTSILKLLPLSYAELASKTSIENDNKLMIQGFYPRLYDKKLDTEHMHKSYIQTYLERDLHQLIHIKDLSKFQQFLTLCAAHCGQVFIASHFSNAIGVSVNTIQSWISILQASYILYLLPPYFSNIKKRLIKSPKLYFYDVGLASYLLGIHTENQINRDPLRGGLFENMVIMDMVKHFTHQGKEAPFFYYRDQQQLEIDLIVQLGRTLIAIEIKSSATFHPEFTNPIKSLSKILDFKKRALLYTGEESFEHLDIQILNWRHHSQTLMPT